MLFHLLSWLSFDVIAKAWVASWLAIVVSSWRDGNWQGRFFCLYALLKRSYAWRLESFDWIFCCAILSRLSDLFCQFLLRFSPGLLSGITVQCKWRRFGLGALSSRVYLLTDSSKSVKLFLIFWLNFAQSRRLARNASLLALIQLFCDLLLILD